jgi:hypothetical protein
MALPLVASAPRAPPLRHCSAASARAAVAAQKGKNCPFSNAPPRAVAQYAHGARLDHRGISMRAVIIRCTGWRHLGPLLDAHPLFSRTALLSCFCADHAVYQQPRRARASDIFGRVWCIWLGVFAEFLRNQLAGVSTPHISRDVRDSTPECAHASAAAQRSVRREIFLRRAHLPVCEATHVDEAFRSGALIALGTRNALGRNALSSHARRKSAYSENGARR